MPPGHGRPTVADLDQQLGDALADGRITDEDAAEVLRFREFLRDCNERGVPAVAADPKWRAYINGEEER